MLRLVSVLVVILSAAITTHPLPTRQAAHATYDAAIPSSKPTQIVGRVTLASSSRFPGDVVSPDDQAAGRCSNGRTMCNPGPNGNGGCYEPRGSTCSGGRVCRRPAWVCDRGPNGSGGCYNPSVSACHSGIICARQFTVCNRTATGGGGCYSPRTHRCQNGRIVRL